MKKVFTVILVGGVMLAGAAFAGNNSHFFTTQEAMNQNQGRIDADVGGYKSDISDSIIETSGYQQMYAETIPLVCTIFNDDASANISYSSDSLTVMGMVYPGEAHTIIAPRLGGLYVKSSAANPSFRIIR
ncbi:hypothetical protein N9104_01750 [Pseudomonadales bacterium]|nr:hypothetical protein [Pseudomonadales bacterium]